MAFKSLYVHWPFCLRRCNYCDFLSHNIFEVQEQAAAYPQALRQELRMYRAYADELVSIYFGGGTPTVMPAEELCSLLDFIRQTYAVREDAEITVECNPATADEAYLRQLRQVGFNRLSLGAQSFQPAELQRLGRAHSAADTVLAVAEARAAGFDNLSLDLMYALPGQTMADLEFNLRTAMRLQPDHISLYSLQLDNDSPWGRQHAKGLLSAADEDLEADMLLFAWQFLQEQGFVQYEIANFAKKDQRDFRSRHNRMYWQREDYLGVGLGAASCLFLRRWQNVGGLAAYINSLLKLHLPPVEEEELTMAQCMSEVMFMGLRQTAGVDIYPVIERFRVDPLRFYAQELPPLYAAGLLEYLEDAHNLRLTKKGLVLANQVFLAFIKDEAEDIQLCRRPDCPDDLAGVGDIEI